MRSIRHAFVLAACLTAAATAGCRGHGVRGCGDEEMVSVGWGCEGTFSCPGECFGPGHGRLGYRCVDGFIEHIPMICEYPHYPVDAGVDAAVRDAASHGADADDDASSDASLDAAAESLDADLDAAGPPLDGEVDAPTP